MMHIGKELKTTERRVIPAATIESRFAAIMVNLLPAASKSAPVRILPSPLQADRTPTSVVASAALAPVESARSFAKLITELPTATRQVI